MNGCRSAPPPDPSLRKFENSSTHIIPIDDAHDPGVGGDFDRMKRKARFLAADEEHRLAHAGPHRIDGDERTADRAAVGGNRLQHEQRHARQVRIFGGGDDVADDPGQLHRDQSPAVTSTASTMPTIAASTGQSFRPAAMRAELPLTMSTVSPTPASTVSTAIR